MVITTKSKKTHHLFFFQFCIFFQIFGMNWNFYFLQHHCRLCGGVYCHSCCNNKVRVATVIEGPQRVCNLCHEHVRGNPLLNDDANQELKETPMKKKKENNFEELESNKTCDWNLLSDDLIIKIFSFLPLSDFFQIPFVCRKFSKTYTSADILWRNLYCLRWNVNVQLTKIRFYFIYFF